MTTAKERLADVRQWRKVTTESPSLGQRADQVYTVAIVTAIFGGLLYDSAHNALAEVLTARGVAIYGPGALLVALSVAARWGAYQGPVVFAVADIAHLLGAPLRRRGLIVRPLLRAVAGGALVGALLGGLAVVGLDGKGNGLSTARDLGLVAGMALLGMLGVVAASGVQSSARAERVLGPLSWLALLAAVGVSVAARNDAAVQRIERWSGPWGWAIAPVSGDSWALALALLAVTVVVGVLAATRWTAACATERHVRRAEARAGAVASLASFDARTMRQALQGASGRRGPRGTRALKAPRGGRPEFLMLWRGATVLRRSPVRAFEAVVIGGAGAAVCFTAGDRPTAAMVGGLALYVAASRLLEPLREEVDAPGRAHILLKAPWGEVLFLHTLLPMAVLVASVFLSAAVCAATGVILPEGARLLSTLLLGVMIATLAAAFSARRGGRLPVSVLSLAQGADASGGSGFLVVGWIVMWPLIGAIGAGGPVAIAGNGGDLFWPLALAFVLAFGLMAGLRATPRP